MKTSQAAEQLGMSESELREINRIPPKMLVKAGSTLLVQRAETRAVDVPEHVADNAHMALAPDVPPLRKIEIRARKGDTVLALAKRYRVGANQIASWNRIDDGTRFRKAQALVIWVPTGSKVAPEPESRALAKGRDKTPARVASASTPRGGAAKGMKIGPARLARK
jgi:membrane-bound lytic murein transglycosylase D